MLSPVPHEPPPTQIHEEHLVFVLADPHLLETVFDDGTLLPVHVRAVEEKKSVVVVFHAFRLREFRFMVKNSFYPQPPLVTTSGPGLEANNRKRGLKAPTDASVGSELIVVYAGSV